MLVAVWTLGGLGALALVPGEIPAQQFLMGRVGPGFLFVLTLIGFGEAHLRSEAAKDRRFWGLLAWCLGLWLAVALGLDVARRWPGERPRIELAGHLAQAALYGLLIFAVETKPHLRTDRPNRRLEQALVVPAAALFVVGWLIYGPVVKLLVGEQTAVPPLLMHGLLDAFLFCRLVQLAWQSTGKWRAVYGALGLAAGAVLAADLAELARALPGIGASASGEALWNLPPLGLILAARLSRRRFAPAAGEAASEPVARPLSSLLWALSFPILHVLFHRWALLEEAGREPREVVVLAMVAGLGGYALFQRSFLVRRSLALWRERRGLEDELRSSEQDLRLILVRRRQRSELERSEQTFSKAFQASHDGLVLTSWEEGIILDVNTAFAEVSRIAKEDLLGRRVSEFGWWSAPEDRAKLLAAILRDGAVRERQLDIEDGEGRRRRLLMSFEKIDLDGQRILLTILHHGDHGFGGSLAQSDWRGLAGGLLNAEDALVLQPTGARRLLNRHAAQLAASRTPFDELEGWTFEGAEGRLSLVEVRR